MLPAARKIAQGVTRCGLTPATRSAVLTTAVRGCASSVPEVKTLGVIGLGLMGHGITQTAAQKGFDVVAVETHAPAMEKGMSMIKGSLGTIAGKMEKKGELQGTPDEWVDSVMGRVTAASDLSALADCDFVIEAVIEDIDVKNKLYTELGQIAKPSAVFASNTSSLRISQMAPASGREDKMVGFHFFNPVQIMKLVEVIRSPATSDESFDLALRVGTALGKTTVSCQDTPGFIVNRLLVPYMAQAVLMYERGEASARDIDVAMKLGTGVPMGPLTLLDYVGVDTSLFILEGWVRDFPNEPTFVVPEILRTMVAEGKLGRKSGQGFYRWEGNKPIIE